MDELLDYLPWLHKRAHQLLPSQDPRHDDLVQEGLVAMWVARTKYDPDKGSLPSWLTSRANWHMITVLSKGNRWTGGLGRTYQTEVERADKPLHPDDSLVADQSDSWALVYHYSEIWEAVSSLTDSQRRYVYLRFWQGMRTSELKEVFGYDPSGLWNSKKNGAKFKLREKLERLDAN